MKVLEVKNVSKSFNGVRVLNDVSFDIFKNDFTVIMGPSGAGKSTLLYNISTMDKPDGGEVIFEGENVLEFSEKRMMRLRGEAFSSIFQTPHLIDNLSVYENIILKALISGRVDYRRVDELINNMGLDGIRDKACGVISGGEGSRVEILRAIVNSPSVLFCDEPTGALNRSNSIEVLDELSRLNRAGQTIVMVTHDLVSALRGNRILYLEDGVIKSELRLDFDLDFETRERELSMFLKEMRW